jgi:hemolysin activation/secretion protein
MINSPYQNMSNKNLNRRRVLAGLIVSGLFSTSALALESDVQPVQSASPVAQAKEIAQEASAPKFSIYEYAVDGNSLLPDLAVENAVSGFMGDEKTLADVEAARAALERVYHEAGYMTVVVSIPEQSVDTGAVSLHVVEATIDRLKVKGAEYVLPSEIKSRVPELAEGKVPNFNKMQEQLTALNRSGDSKVTPILRAGREPGTVEVQLDVEDQFPLHGSVDVSNRQTPNTTPTRMSASMRYDNLWQLRHSLGMTVQLAPERATDARVLASTYVMPVGSGGESLTMYAVNSRSQFASLAGASDFQLLGNSDTFGTRLSLPLGTGIDYSQSLSAGLDYKNIRQTTNLTSPATATVLVTNSPITYVPLVASYTGNLFNQERSSTLDVTATSGLRGFFGNTDLAFNAKRAGTSASFLALHTGIQHTENLYRWALYGKLDTQFSSGPLVPTEQFAIGGAESVRGYMESERAGDAGARLTVELRTPQFNLDAPGSAWRVSGLVFFDTARVMISNQTTPLLNSYSLRGAGFGMRFVAPRGLSLEVDAAHALTDGAYTVRGANRVHARTLWSF